MAETISISKSTWSQDELSTQHLVRQVLGSEAFSRHVYGGVEFVPTVDGEVQEYTQWNPHCPLTTLVHAGERFHDDIPCLSYIAQQFQLKFIESSDCAIFFVDQAGEDLKVNISIPRTIYDHWNNIRKY